MSDKTGILDDSIFDDPPGFGPVKWEEDPPVGDIPQETVARQLDRLIRWTGEPGAAQAAKSAENDLIAQALALKGSRASGNWGHSSHTRVGKGRGGSDPGGGLEVLNLPRSSSAQERRDMSAELRAYAQAHPRKAPPKKPGAAMAEYLKGEGAKHFDPDMERGYQLAITNALIKADIPPEDLQGALFTCKPPPGYKMGTYGYMGSRGLVLGVCYNGAEPGTPNLFICPQATENPMITLHELGHWRSEAWQIRREGAGADYTRDIEPIQRAQNNAARALQRMGTLTAETRHGIRAPRGLIPGEELMADLYYYKHARPDKYVKGRAFCIEHGFDPDAIFAGEAP